MKRLSFLALYLAASLAGGATLPAGFTETILTSSLTEPTAMTVSPDGRIFVCEKQGALRVVENGALLATPFLTVAVNSAGERGLLGVAFDPNFDERFVYVYYTVPDARRTTASSRFIANGDVAAAGSELVLFDLDNL